MRYTIEHSHKNPEWPTSYTPVNADTQDEAQQYFSEFVASYTAEEPTETVRLIEYKEEI